MKTAYELMLENPAVIAPLMGQMSKYDQDLVAEQIIASVGDVRHSVGGDQWWTILKPDPELVKAATPLLSQYMGQRAALSTTNKEQLLALQAMMAQTKGTNPTAYAEYLKQYNALKQPWYVQYKWPLLIGALGVAAVAFAFVVKGKMFEYAPGGGFHLRA